MNNDIPVLVTSKFFIPDKIKNKLKNKYHLHWNGTGYAGFANTRRERMKLQSFCNKNKLKFEINTCFGKRSRNYRNEFFNHYHPLFWDVYLCAYCGKPVRKKNITVDHIIPIDKVNKSISLQQTLINMGADSVNCFQNLTPACSKCNSKKSAKMNYLTIKKGFFFQNQYLRLTADFVYLFVIIMFIILFTYFLF